FGEPILSVGDVVECRDDVREELIAVPLQPDAEVTGIERSQAREQLLERSLARRAALRPLIAPLLRLTVRRLSGVGAGGSAAVCAPSRAALGVSTALGRDGFFFEVFGFFVDAHWSAPGDGVCKPRGPPAERSAVMRWDGWRDRVQHG